MDKGWIGIGEAENFVDKNKSSFWLPLLEPPVTHNFIVAYQILLFSLLPLSPHYARTS
jgi:hypothetical protein